MRCTVEGALQSGFDRIRPVSPRSAPASLRVAGLHGLLQARDPLLFLQNELVLRVAHELPPRGQHGTRARRDPEPEEASRERLDLRKRTFRWATEAMVHSRDNAYGAGVIQYLATHCCFCTTLARKLVKTSA